MPNFRSFFVLLAFWFSVSAVLLSAGVSIYGWQYWAVLMLVFVIIMWSRSEFGSDDLQRRIEMCERCPHTKLQTPES